MSIGLNKTLDGKWEVARESLRSDLITIETVLNQLKLSKGVLAARAGGTGFGSYAVGDLLYANTVTTLARLADVATGNVLLSGGVGVAPAWGKVSLSSAVSGILPIANGGTNSGTALSGSSLMMSNATAIVQAGITVNAAGTALTFPTISAPSTPAASHGTMYALTTNGHTFLHWLDEGGSDLILERDNVLLVRNTSGGPLTKGTAVDLFGATGQVPNVRAADNTSASKHTEGVLQETIANNGFGLCVVQGYVQNIDTSAFTDGDILYTGTGGALINSAPAFPTAKFQQRIGVVVYAHATQGIIQVELSNFKTLVDPATDLVVPGDATKFLDGTGVFSTPATGGVTAYAIGTTTIPTGDFLVMSNHLILTSTQRMTVQGNGRLAIVT